MRIPLAWSEYHLFLCVFFFNLNEPLAIRPFRMAHIYYLSIYLLHALIVVNMSWGFLQKAVKMFNPSLWLSKVPSKALQTVDSDLHAVLPSLTLRNNCLVPLYRLRSFCLPCSLHLFGMPFFFPNNFSIGFIVAHCDSYTFYKLPNIPETKKDIVNMVF